MRQAQTFDFSFKNVEKQHESYQGINVKLRCARSCDPAPSAANRVLRYRYFVRVSIARRMADVMKEKDLWVHSFRMPPDSNNSIKMEVGIEDCLHIEFEYNKSKYVQALRVPVYVPSPFRSLLCDVPLCYSRHFHSLPFSLHLLRSPDPNLMPHAYY